MFYKTVQLVQVPDEKQNFGEVLDYIRADYHYDAGNVNNAHSTFIMEIDPMPIPNEMAHAQKNIVFPPRQGLGIPAAIAYAPPDNWDEEF